MTRQAREIPFERRARAPYNFVPLPERALAAPTDADRDDAGYFDAERLSGTLELTIEAKTPIFVGHETGINVHEPNFFRPNGQPETIPGSTLRGMTRVLVEIVSWSKLQWTSERRLYGRAVADPTRLGDNYRRKLVGPTGYHGLTGWVYRLGRDYVIRPARPVGSPARHVFRIDSKAAGAQIKMDLSRRNPWQRFAVVYQPPATGAVEVTAICLAGHPSATPPGWCRGWLVRPGPMPGRWLWIVPDPIDDQELGQRAGDITLSREDVQEYCDDLDRTDAAGDARGAGTVKSRAWSVLPDAEYEPNSRVRKRRPCFYLVTTETLPDGQTRPRVALGHTGMFRLPFVRRLIDAVPKAVREVDGQRDLAEAIFGVAGERDGDGFAGRVFFEDAPCIRPGEAVEAGPRGALMGPKPTAVQHYVVQDHPHKDYLLSWDDDARVRGYKTYWHRPPAWRATDTSQTPRTNPSLHPTIAPLGTGTQFRGRVRFENLSRVELGVLLFALDLPPECAHKLGLGKALGLGSVRISCRLRVEPRAERYDRLFDDDGWHVRSEAGPEADTLKDTFAAWIFAETGIVAEGQEGLPDWLRYWQTWRLRELYAMLLYDPSQRAGETAARWSWARRPEACATKPMLPPTKPDARPSYRERPVLPRPSVVAGWPALEEDRQWEREGQVVAAPRPASIPFADAGPMVADASSRSANRATSPAPQAGSDATATTAAPDPSPPMPPPEPHDAAAERALERALRADFSALGLRASARMPGKGLALLVERPEILDQGWGAAQRGLGLSSKERLVVVPWQDDPARSIMTTFRLEAVLGYEPTITVERGVATVRFRAAGDVNRIRGWGSVSLGLVAAVLGLRQIVAESDPS